MAATRAVPFYLLGLVCLSLRPVHSWSAATGISFHGSSSLGRATCHRHVSLKSSSSSGENKLQNSSEYESLYRKETETLRREYQRSVDASKELPGFLKGALDPLRLRRQEQERKRLELERQMGQSDSDSQEEENICDRVPTNIEMVVSQAQINFATAVSLDMKRIRCDVLVPGLNEVIENRFPYDESTMFDIAFRLATFVTPMKVKLLFESAGTAASAKEYYMRSIGKELPPTLSFGTFSSARVIRDRVNQQGDDMTPEVRADDLCDIYMVVRPKDNRGDSVILAVEQAVQKLPGATWVLLNPILEDTVGGYTFGIRETDRRRSFLSQFEIVYLYRGLFLIQRPSLIPSERGAILKNLGQPYRVFKLNNQGYELLGEFKDKPGRNDLNGLPW